MAKKLITFLYPAAALLIFPLLVLFVALRRDLRPGILRRFFPAGQPGNTQYIWLHAASAGEARQAVALSRLLKEKHPGIPLLLSTNTESGRKEAERHEVFDSLLSFPFDMQFALKRIFNIYKPRLLILIESEYWPGLLGLAEQNGVPVIAVNARLSRRTGKFFSVLDSFSGGALKRITFSCADESELSSLSAAGVSAARLRVCGNIKIDMFLDEFTAESPEPASEKPLLLAASTHLGEEEILLEAFAEIRRSHRNMRLLIAPRHVERAAAILQSAQKRGWKAAYSNSAEALQADVEIINEFGKLTKRFGQASIVFVGGSLTEHGGHNLLEPVLARKPLFYGPHIWRWKRWSDMLIKCGAAQIVADKHEIAKIVTDFLDNSLEKSESIAKAQNIIYTHRGALLRNYEMILEMLERGLELGD